MIYNVQKKRTLCDCLSKGDLTFVIDGKQEIGLRRVDFVVRQEIIMSHTQDSVGGTLGYQSIEGFFYPKDAETATKLLQQLDTMEICTILGIFEDRNTGREGEVTL